MQIAKGKATKEAKAGAERAEKENGLFGFTSARTSGKPLGVLRVPENKSRKGKDQWTKSKQKNETARLSARKRLKL